MFLQSFDLFIENTKVICVYKLCCVFPCKNIIHILFFFVNYYYSYFSLV